MRYALSVDPGPRTLLPSTATATRSSSGAAGSSLEAVEAAKTVSNASGSTRQAMRGLVAWLGGVTTPGQRVGCRAQGH